MSGMGTDWDAVLRRMAAGEALADILDGEAIRQRRAMCEYLASIGRADLRKEYEARLDALELGISGAQSTWHSISDAQRRLVARMGERASKELVRSGPPGGRAAGVYDLRSGFGTLTRTYAIARVATVRNLAARELLEWTGGAFDPEASAIATEKLFFTLKHGPRTDIHNPWTSAPKPVPVL